VPLPKKPQPLADPSPAPAELQATIAELRADLKAAKDGGATKAELDVLRADIDAKLDELKAAKAAPPPAPAPNKEPNAEETTKQEAVAGTRRRRGFFTTAA